MLQSASLIPGLVNEVHFKNDFSFLRLLDAEGDLLLNIRISVPDGKIFINDQTDNVWGERVHIQLPPQSSPDFLKLWFKLENHLEFWNTEAPLSFERFDRKRGSAVRFCHLKNATNPNGTLTSQVPRPEEMAAMISSQVAQRRADLTEKRLDQLLQRLDIAEGNATERATQ